MARLDDLIELVRSANDVYLINPARNARMAYIQVDDLCELALKSWLQEHVHAWLPIDHQHNGREYYKGFPTVIDEVKVANAGNAVLANLLDAFKARRENRNRFFHDQNLTGLTVAEPECLAAFCDLYRLMDALFAEQFRERLEASGITKAQVAIIRLKDASQRTGLFGELCQKAVSEVGPLYVQPQTLGHEYRAIYDNAGLLHQRLRECAEEQLAAWQKDVDYYNGRTRKFQKNEAKKARLESSIRDVSQFMADYLP